MKFFVVVMLALVASASAEVAFSNGASLMEVKAECFPNCAWNCDRPVCPAKCEPQCEKPSCELRCEKLPETQCDIRCEKPKCEVRCSKNNCQSGGCPLCENVCMPAKCQTVCTPAKPVCKPVCSAPKCNWSCQKPASCPRPKCSLQCAKKAGETPSCGQGQCCGCSRVGNMQSAIELASKAHVENFGAVPHEDVMPSMVEVAHEIRHQAQLGAEAMCCPCSEPGMPEDM